MLGSMVFDYFSKQDDFNVLGTVRDEFEAGVDKLADKILPYFKPDYIINCIGVIKPYCKDNDSEGVLRAIKINALFPHQLAEEETNSRIIQIATDCVYSGQQGNYLEDSPHDALDVYGKTKSLGEVFQPNFLNLRCSIIGPELKNKASLLEWFLSQPKDKPLTGFTHHLWNGVTTLQFAQFCHNIIRQSDDYFDDLVRKSPTYHTVLNETVNKFELLNIFNKVFDAGLTIEATDKIGAPVNRTIKSKFNINPDPLIPMEQAVQDLKDYINLNNFYDHGKN